MTQPPQGPPPGFVVLTVQGSSLTSNMISPAVTLNGYPVPTSYGENTLPVPPGRWHVAVQAQWMRVYGQADVDVDVTSGQAVRLFYAAPWHQFSSGSIGFEKQKRKGGGVFLAMMLALLLVVAAFVVLPLVL
ncbi:hypothetical protein [Nocardioides sp.]|uniref:hypothetical protein n=1 Tax=Nocardioides sp. TaxID=35761 RepID=UPI002715C471|nr:hypothetical protein [Nocardioides sp.]MDO9456052.1 hypothetical protein [Nocardioides sp.]